MRYCYSFNLTVIAERMLDRIKSFVLQTNDAQRNGTIVEVRNGVKQNVLNGIIFFLVKNYFQINF